MRHALTYKRLVRIHRRFLIRASNLVGGKDRFIRLSKFVATLTAGCSFILLAAQGCATTPPQPLTQDVRSSLGTIGVVSIGPLPVANVEGPVGGGREAGRGALKGGAIGGLGGAGIGALAGLFTGPCAPAFVPAFAAIGAVGGGVLGAGTGAIVRGANAIPTETAESLEAALNGAISARALPGNLRERLLARGPMTARQPVDLGNIDGDPAGAPDYGMFAANGVHSVLEVTIAEVFFEGEGGSNPSFALSMKAQTRLIRVADNQVLWSNNQIMFRSTDADVSMWTAEESGYLANELASGVGTLARQIGDEVFLETQI